MKYKKVIAIVDDHYLFRKGFKALLYENANVEVLFEAENGVQLLEKLDVQQPEIIFLDIDMPEMDGIEAAERVRARYPNIKIIILTSYFDETLALSLMEKGVNSFLSKNTHIEIIIKAINSVMTEGNYFEFLVSKVMAKGLVWSKFRNSNKELPNLSKYQLAKEKEKNQSELNSVEQQIKMLKAQMDPHFIFNSLNTILQFIITQENAKAELYLTKFSKLIRKLLESNTNEFISLEDEIDILEKYMEIEALRFDREIETQIEIDKKIDTCKMLIPHMMIQPFVENAVWHGLRQKEGLRTLNISFMKISEKKLSCVVDDNGIGRKKNVDFQSGLTRSLAIHLIKQRLELMGKKYGEDYNLNIIDKIDYKDQSLGTKVEITIPIIQNVC